MIVFTVLGAIVAPAVGATIIATIDVLRGKHWFLTAWLLVWLGDGSGLLVSTPLALAVVRAWRERERIVLRRVVEAAILGLLLVGIAALALRGWLPTAYMTMPFVLWAAVRFQVPGAAVAVALLTLTTAIFTMTGDGEFIGPPEVQQEKIVMLQVFLGVTAVSALLMATLSRQRQMALEALDGMNRDLERRVEERSASLRVAEQQLRASEERLRLFVEQAPAAIAMFDRDMRYLAASDRWVSDYGLADRGSLVGQSHYDVFPEIPNRWREVHCRAMGGEIVQAEDDAFERTTGMRQWLRWEVRPWRKAGGEIGGIVIFTEDVTVRKQAEEGMKQSEERFRHAADAVSGFIYECNLVTQRVEASAGLETLLGVNPSELTHLRQWADRVHPEDLPRIQQAVSQHHEGTVRNSQAEYRIRHRDGHYLTVWDNAVVIRDQSGRAMQAIGHIIDITDRKKTEAELSQAAERAKVAQLAARATFYDFRPTTGEVIRNETLKELLGYAPEELEASKGGWHALIHPEDVAAFDAAAEAAVLDGVPISLEYRVRHKSGYWVWMSDQASVVRDSAGAVERIVGLVKDITERKQAESRFQLAVRAVNGVVWEWDVRTGHVFRSDGLLALIGVRPEDAAPTRNWWVERIHPDDLTRLMARADDVLNTRPQFEGDYRIRHEDGRWIDIWERGLIERDSDGQAVRLVGFTADVSARKQAEEQVRASEERLRLALEGADLGSWDVNVRTGTAVWNRRHASMQGYDPDSAPASIQRWQDRVHPDDLNRVLAEVERVKAERGLFSVEHRTLRADTGEERWLSLYGRFYYDEFGEPVRFSGVSLDITERKQTEEALKASEARFRSMANTTPAIIWTADPQGNITFHNQRWLDYTGIDPKDNVRDWPRLVLHPDDYDRCVREWTRALQTGTKYAIEVRNRRHDGEYRWFLTRAEPIRDAAGRVVEWYGSTTDIHDRKLAEEALMLADKRKDEFLAMLGHELRNPLAPISNAVALLRKLGPKEPVLDDARDLIDRQVKHLTRIVDDLLDVSRVSRGKIILQKTHMDLTAAVCQGIETSRPLLDSRGHQLCLTLPPNAVMVEGDIVRLAQVVSNLLNNAAKYTDEGGRIEVTVAQVDDEARISVRDTGRGIDPTALHSLFDLFYQVDHNLDRSEGGLGIGLSLVKSLIEMHGGRIEAHSAGRGKGSEFIVHLPCVAKCVTSSSQASATTPALTSSLRVLVVDDNRDSVKSLAMLLRLDGHDILTAHDGSKAVEITLKERPNVVLLDIGLPRLDGYQACKAIRKAGFKETLIVAMTGYGQEEDRRLGYEVGFNAHLVKPIDLLELKRLLQQCAETQK